MADNDDLFGEKEASVPSLDDDLDDIFGEKSDAPQPKLEIAAMTQSDPLLDDLLDDNAIQPVLEPSDPVVQPEDPSPEEPADSSPVSPMEPAPEVADPTPEVADPAPEVADPAPEVAAPAPEVAAPAPEVAAPAPEVADPAPVAVDPTPDPIEATPVEIDLGEPTADLPESTPVLPEPVSSPVLDDTDDDLFQDVMKTPEKKAEPEVDIFGDKEDDDDDKLFDEEISLSDGNAAPPAVAQLSEGAAILSDVKTIAEKEEEEGGDTFDINIKLSDPEKVGDGMSAYMAYSVTTQTSIATFKRSEFSVRRRFSDFLGLHERLSEKHSGSGRIVPPPPDKSVVGMVKVKGSKDDQSSTDFVAKRKHALEKFLNRIARHGVLLDDHDFREFLEAEELPRAKNTSALSRGGLSRLAKAIGDGVSKMTTKMNESDSWYEDKQSRIDELDTQVRKLHSASDVLCSLRREVAINTAAFSKSISLLSGSEEHSGLSRALTQLAELEEKVEQIQSKQAETDFYVLAETLREYIGLIGSVKAAFAQRVKVWGNWQSAQTTLGKKREALVKLELSGKADKVVAAKEEVTEWERRVEKGEEEFEAISKAIKVEVANFETMRVKDFKDLIVGYLESLLGIEQQLVKLWEGFGPVAKSIC